MALDLDTLKAQTNVTGSADDAILTRILAAASAHTARQLGFALDDADEFPGGTPDDVEHAVLMLAAHWYENREASIVGVAAQSVPFGYAEILAERRRYSFGADDGE
ncbi:MAG: phage gp6-like head-tail connector protein [Rhizobiales bacterium]|nr:phage gp6-like head-tail connector protein [Hyphomicrobiales bacterium]